MSAALARSTTEAAIVNDSPASHAPAPSMHALLEFLAGLDAESTGGVVFSDGLGPVGTVLLERGKVCFAAAAATRDRFTELIRRHVRPSPGADIESEVLRCVRAGERLSDALSRSTGSAEGVRRAFEQHTVESLALLAGCSQHHFVPHRRGGYAPPFTFGLVELLASFGALRFPDAARQAESLLARVLRGGSAAAFHRGESGLPELVAVARLEDHPLGELLALGNAGIELVDLVGLFSLSSEIAVSSDERGRSLLAWCSGSLVCVTLCEDSALLAPKLAAISRTLGRAQVARL